MKVARNDSFVFKMVTAQHKDVIYQIKVGCAIVCFIHIFGSDSNWALNTKKMQNLAEKDQFSNKNAVVK